MEHAQFNNLIEQLKIKLHETTNDINSLNQWKTQMFTLINKIAELKLSYFPSAANAPHASLDPVNWTSARCVAHQVLDSALDHLEFIRDRPVWQPIPHNVQHAITQEPLPEHGQSLEKVCYESLTNVLPYSLGNTHPRFWGWATGEGTVGGILADIIATSMNVNNVGGNHSAVLVEQTVIKWMRQVFNFPETDVCGGLIVSGTSMATVISMAIARQRAVTNAKQDGLAHGPQLIAYASTQTHNCFLKSLELLGIGSKAMRFIPVDDNFCIKIDELKTAIRIDREKGFVPLCIVGNAGTVNTGAFDNLAELASIARSENIWFHVDGAFGSLIILDSQRRHLVSGIDQADSLAFDFHKWLHCPYDAGCVLIRNSSLLEPIFSTHHSYLVENERSCSAGNVWFNNIGPELSRTFRALKVWFTLKEHGITKLGEKIAENCEQAQYLVKLLEQNSDFIRIVRPVTLNIVNFRFEPKELDKTNIRMIDAFNNELVSDMQMMGVAVPSTTEIGDRLYIRVAILSHRSTLEDFHVFINTLLKFFRRRLQEYGAQHG